MGWWRKANNQNNVEEVIATIIFKKLISQTSYCVHTVAHHQCVHTFSYSYLAQSRTKYYYLYVKKHYTSTIRKEENEIFINISCLTQRKRKHLTSVQANAPVSLHYIYILCHYHVLTQGHSIITMNITILQWKGADIFLLINFIFLLV